MAMPMILLSPGPDCTMALSQIVKWPWPRLYTGLGPDCTMAVVMFFKLKCKITWSWKKHSLFRLAAFGPSDLPAAMLFARLRGHSLPAGFENVMQTVAKHFPALSTIMVCIAALRLRGIFDISISPVDHTFCVERRRIALAL